MESYRLPQGESFEVPKDKVLINNHLFPKQIGAFPTRAQITPSQYALIQDGDRVVAISSLQQYNGSNFANLNQGASRDGVILATPRQFLTNWRNVNQALAGETARYNASGELMQPTQLVADAQVANNAWAYLNARFPKSSEEQAFRGLDLVTITLDKDGKPVLTRVPLQPCLENACLADIESVNAQGFPTQRAKTNKYEPGKTFNFYPPVLREDKPEEGWVAWFDAAPLRASFYCYGRPDDVYPSLGGFVCAEGASEKIGGKD